MTKSKKIIRNKPMQSIKKYGNIIEYSDNKLQDKVLLEYILNNPKSNIIVLLPTINLSRNLRHNIYDYIKCFGMIKAVKKIKLDFDNVVKLVHHFYVNQKKEVDIMEIIRQIMLDVSRQMGETKTLYVVIWHKNNKLNYKQLEKILKKYLIDKELNKVVDNDLSEYVSEHKVIEVSPYRLASEKNSLHISDYYENDSLVGSRSQSGGGSEIINEKSYPLHTENKSDQEVTLNFLSNIITDKLYMCMTHDYYETVLFAKILLSKKIIKNL